MGFPSRGLTTKISREISVKTETLPRVLDQVCYPSKPLSSEQWSAVERGVGGLECGYSERAYFVVQNAVESGKPLLRVLRLGVDPGARREGLASGILAQFRGVNCEAVVGERNLPGLKLLCSAGFEVLGLLGEERDRVYLYRVGRKC